jgi:hypothetical protein
MKKKIFVLAVVVLLGSFIGSLAIAGGPKDTSGPSGKSNEGQIYLYQKCIGTETDGFCALLDIFSAPCPLTDDVTPERVGTSWGKLKYNLQGPTFDFEFEGHGLMPGSYTLIYLPNFDGCPGYLFTYFGSDVAKGDGNVHINGSLDTGNLPGANDDSPLGAKIWLVLSEDIYLPYPQFLGWHPSMYLFEEKLITYTSD